jgi:iron complex outermembrane receptor protein
VRGPVSALYGANAFFGAVNVITRDAPGTRPVVSAGLRGNDDFGIGTSASYLQRCDTWDVAFGVSLLTSDYDGRRLPESSPDYDRFAGEGNLVSRDTATRPMSAYGKSAWRLGPLELVAQGRFSQLYSVAEFLDFGTLSHENRIVLQALDARLAARWLPWNGLSVTGSFGVADGGPAASERLSTGAVDSYPRRRFGYTAWDAVLEARLHLFDDDSLTVGVDWSSDDEDLIEVYSVDADTGMETLTSEVAGRRTLTNAGAYAQIIVHPVEALGLTGNLRYDHHNVYGGATHYRLGAVWTPLASLAGKLLYGTSFKAPAALQLYAQPLVPGEVVGNDELAPETASLLEAEVTWRPTASLLLATAGFVSEVHDKVELVPVGTNLQPSNLARQEGFGVEAQLRWKQDGHALDAILAYQNTDTVLATVFQGELSAPSERYPRLTEQLRWRYYHPIWGMPGIALRYASQRRASSVNVRENLQVPYSLPWYLAVDLVYAWSWERHRIHLRVDNVLDADDAEPGFGGIDLPARGRRAWITYTYEWAIDL